MADGVPTYDELKLRIARTDKEFYSVTAIGPDGGSASGSLLLPFTDIELENFVLRVGHHRRGTRAYRSSRMEDAKRFGLQLFNALVTGAIRDIYVGAQRAAEAHQRGLRVTLDLTDAPKLMGVPWELLYEPPRFLSQSIYTPLVRSLDFTSVRVPRAVNLPLRILGMVSRPQGWESLDLEREKQKLTAALEPLQRSHSVEVEWLERATLSQLHNMISRPDDVHILHYVGHGAYDKRTEAGILLLEDELGGPHEVTGEEIGSLLQDERSLRLVVLNTCEGARSSHVDPFSGVASSVVAFGIPSVIGMQFEITDDAAITFSGRLYGALAQGYPVDAALAEARKAIFAGGYDIEFGTPVLFLRGTDAHLFDVKNAPERLPSAEYPPDETAQVNALPATESTVNWSKGAPQVLELRHSGVHTGVSGKVWRVTFSLDGELIATAGDDGTARVWDANTGRELTRVTHDGRVWEVAFSPDGHRIATASDDNTAAVWDADTGRELTRVTHNNLVWHVVFSPDGQRIATASDDNTAGVWDADTGRELTRVTHNNLVWHVVYSPDGQRIATASVDKTAGVWEADTGRELTRVTHNGSLGFVAFSPDGQRIATASYDKTAGVWTADAGQQLTRVAHKDIISRVVFSPDGQLTATASDDNTAGVWEADTGRELTRVTHDRRVGCVAFSPDGRRIATASDDNTARVWKAGT
jgi:Tol biopolymer transport system component